jgi:2-dehydropantoate 2-reductase
METDKPRILIVGAGVNGSACASGLHDAGTDVTVLARGARYQELTKEGIVIEDPFRGKRSVTRVPVIDHLGPDDTYDYILVVVRKNQVADLLPVLARNRSPSIVFMGNNLSGPGPMVEALGKDRVMMGAVYAAGKRDGGIVRAVVFRSVAAPFGEVDGAISPRLRRLLAIWRRAGFKAEASTNIVDTQTTHAVGVALIGPLTLRHGCDVRALARSAGDLRLFVEARREAHQVLRALGRQIIPRSEAFLGAVPSFVQVAGFRMLLRSKWGEVGLAWHCSQAPDEIQQLAAELRALVEQAGLPAPAIRKLLAPDEGHAAARAER